jgi:CelD/BcsL family acetyltransferase involved in cellulose biosynthesis
MRPEFDILTTSAELESLRAEWKALWLEDPNATPFQAPEWLLPWWHHFGQQELRVLTICDAQGLLALVPFYLYPDDGWGEQRLLLLGAGTSDYLDGIFSPRCTAERLREGIDLLRKEDCSWGRLDVLQLRPGSLLATVLDFMGGASIEAEPCSRTAAVRFEELPRKMRRNLTLGRNRAQRRGGISLLICNEADWQANLRLLHRLHTERWEEKGNPGVVADDRVRAWHEEAMPLLLDAGLARLSVLWVGTDAAAVLWSLCDSQVRTWRTEYFYLTGFDPRFAEISPGALLYALVIDRAAREGYSQIDLLRGRESYKELWHTQPEYTQGYSLARLRVPVAA